MKISELQSKDVVNIANGKKLGKIYDLEIDMRRGKIKSLIIPGEAKLFGWGSNSQEWVIPWRRIVKIGSDVILVRLDSLLEDEHPIESHSLYSDENSI